MNYRWGSGWGRPLPVLLLTFILLFFLISVPLTITGGHEPPSRAQGTNRPYAQSPSEFLPRVTIVHTVEGNLSTEYQFLASIPMSIFHYNGTVYQSLLLSDSLTDTATGYIHDDWKTYLTGWGGCQHLNFIGAVPPATKMTVMTHYNVTWDHVTNITGDPLTVANEIALHDWVHSDRVVIAPYLASLTRGDVESISNAVVIASLNNAPLLFTAPEGLSPETLDVIAEMGATSALLVELNDTLTATVSNQLLAAGVSLQADFLTTPMIISYLRNITGQSLLCGILMNWQNLPAALTGARYGGYVLFLPDALRSRANLVLDDIRALDIPPHKLSLPYSLPMQIRAGEQTIAADFYAWLTALGGSDPTQLETVITFHTQPYFDPTNGFAVTFDRAISGDPAYPTQTGAVTGRMPLPFIENIAVANRGGLYRAVIHANPRPTHITLSMTAYEVQHSFAYDDNYGDNHNVNEIFGWPLEGWTSTNGYFPWPPSGPDLSPLWPPAPGTAGHDSGVFATFTTSGYETHFHSGSGPGTGSHPAQPTVNLMGFVADVNQGSAYLYISCHGGGTTISVASTDNGLYQDISFGGAYWPASDGRVNYSPGSYSQTSLNNDLGNTHCLIIGYNACDMANGKMNEILLQHGGIGSIGSYTSVSFDGSGWWWCLHGYLITTLGYTLGEAATYASARVADVYTPGHIVDGDSSLNYVHYGDPLAPFSQLGWTSPEPATLDVNYGGHHPDNTFNYSEYTFTFSPKWNLITVPLAHNYTAEPLGQLIPTCTAVIRFDAPTQTFTTHVVGTPWDDFPLTDGAGYFIYLLDNATLPLMGVPITTISVPISVGWNLIGWCRDYNTTADTLGNSIDGTTALSMFDAETQQFISHITLASSWDNFPVTPGMGLFLYTTQASTWDGDI